MTIYGNKPPLGRLTLTSGVSVLTSNVVGATTVYYDPYIGRYFPVYNSAMDVFQNEDFGGELSQSLSDTTKSPGASVANKIYPMFLWKDVDIYRCTRGYAWAGDNSIGTGAGTSEMTYQGGMLVNRYGIANGPPAQTGVFAGLIRTDGANTVACNIFSPSTSPAQFIWNYYNRYDFVYFGRDVASNWSYGTAAWRLANSPSNIGVMLLSMGDDVVDAYYNSIASAPASGWAGVAVGVDTTTAYSGSPGGHGIAALVAAVGKYVGIPATPGMHTYSPIEFSNGGTSLFVGNQGLSGFIQTGFFVKGRF